ncbi:DUF6037 family protein [Rhodanobacter sp. Si-c]|uniref:DUF6037 family protein n=1 Tax=Rhodanobacter lycopersici TaxID=3162487 RepID=A0ABV3QEX8_9GAMM
MRLTGLQPLYRSMRAQNMGRAKFRYQHNHLTFECLFFADLEPFELVLGCLGEGFTIFVEVHQGFAIRTFIEPPEAFFALRRALFQQAGNDHRLNPAEFFAEFNRHIPDHTTPAHTPSADDVVRYYPHIEHADKRYFCGWLDNNKQGNRVSPENLAKTRRLQGQRAHDFSLRRNQSTRWTHKREDAVAFFVPPE